MNNNNNNFNISLQLNQWFNISIDKDKLEIFSNDLNDTSILIFEYEKGEIRILNQYGDKNIVNNPTIEHSDSNSIIFQVFYRFLAVLRNKNNHV